MFLAPTEGYTNLFSFEQAANASGWGDTTGDMSFFVTLHDGRAYGRVCIEIRAGSQGRTGGMVHLSYALNPSGSHVLR